MDIYIITYQHKHGLDVGVYKTEKGALKAAHQLAYDQVDGSWDDEDQKKEFLTEEDPALALQIFHEVEGETSYGEVIEIISTTLQD